MAHFKKGAKRRADILIKDNDDHVICLIEFKGPNKVLTDNIFDQLLRHDEIVKAETFCIVIGSCFYFYAFVGENKQLKLLSDFPTFKTLMEEGQVNYLLPEEVEFEKYIFKEPLEENIVTRF
jgi:hypothetical protein